MGETEASQKGAPNGAGDDDAGLLTRADALAYLKIDTKTLQRWQKAGLVVPIIRLGRPWYDPRELTAAAEAGDEELDLVSELRKMIADLASQNAKLLGMVTEPAKVFTTALNEYCTRLVARDESHEAKWLEVVKLIEELAQHKHERDIDIRKYEQGEKRKDEMLELAKKVAPSIVDSFVLKKFRSFLGNLGDERIAFLLDKESAFLDDQMRADLASIIVALKRTENLKGTPEDGKQRRDEPRNDAPAESGGAPAKEAARPDTGEAPRPGDTSASVGHAGGGPEEPGG